MVSQIYYYNTDKFQAIADDYSNAKTRVEKITKQTHDNSQASVFGHAMEAIPTFRRTASVPEKLKNGDYLTTAGILAYTAVNAKEDLNDLISAGKQIYSKINPNYNYDPFYDRKNYQHEFSATKNVIGEKTLYEACDKGNPFANIVRKAGNTTIDNTKFGRWLTKKFKIKIEDVQKVDAIRNYDGKCARAYAFASPILGGEAVARGMKRTTIAGVAIMGLFELPKIAKEAMKGDNFFEHVGNGAKQVINSAGNIALTTAGIAIGGTLGAKHLGATGSIVGMGIGAVAGSKLSNQLQTVIG